MMRRVAGYVLRTHLRLRWQFRRWQADQSGFTAVEFAIVAMPFVMLLFGTISVCLFYFTTFTMENAVWQASRGIRTGQFQQGVGCLFRNCHDRGSQESIQAGTVREGTRLRRLQQGDRSCPEQQRRLRQHYAARLRDRRHNDRSVDGRVQSRRRQLRGAHHGLLSLGASAADCRSSPCNNMKDGSLLIQASVAFRTEPYPTN